MRACANIHQAAWRVLALAKTAIFRNMGHPPDSPTFAKGRF